MCQVWFHAFSVKSDQGSQRWPKGIAVYVNFSIPPSLVITQVKKSLKITFSSISPYSHNIFILFLFSSLLFQAISPSSLLCTSPLLFYHRVQTTIAELTKNSYWPIIENTHFVQLLIAFRNKS